MKDNNSIFVLGFGLSGYRSFGPELQRIGPCQKINLIIGQNNSGKSNVLHFLHDHYGRFLRGEWKLQNLEVYRSTQTFSCRLSLALSATEEHLRRWEEHARQSQREVKQQLQRVLGAVGRDKCGEGFWVEFIVPASGGRAQISEGFVAEVAKMPGLGNVCYELNMLLRASSPTGNDIAAVYQMIEWMVNELAGQVKCVKIPSLRSPGASEWKANDFSGAGIIQRMAQLQNPDHDRQELNTDFNLIEQFLQEVTAHPDARLEVPYKRDTITVHMDGR